MRFSVYLPPKALAGTLVPAVYYLAGLTCNEETPAHEGSRPACRRGARLGARRLRHEPTHQALSR